MSPAVDLQGTLASLRQQAEALRGLQLRCAGLRESGERTHAQLDALAAAIDERIDESLLIAERAAAADPQGSWQGAVRELERQLRLLGVLRSQVLALHVGAVHARCGS